jgi:hypothetical protein
MHGWFLFYSVQLSVNTVWWNWHLDKDSCKTEAHKYEIEQMYHKNICDNKNSAPYQKLINAQMLKKCPSFVEPEGLFITVFTIDSGPCSELDESSHHPPILLTAKFNISLPSVSRSSGWFFPLKFPAKVFYRHLNHVCYMLSLSYSLIWSSLIIFAITD